MLPAFFYCACSRQFTRVEFCANLPLTEAPMRRSALSVLVSLLFAFPFAENSPGLQSLPGLHKAQSRMDIPFDPPASASRKTADPAQLEDEAAELARLS